MSEAWKHTDAIKTAKSKWGPAWDQLGERTQAGEIAIAALALMAQQDEDHAEGLGGKFQSLAIAVMQSRS
tara:strand:- start:1095 stop:1304 length:210 start_codon:yes stop_codon:yes gene_type:complete